MKYFISLDMGTTNTRAALLDAASGALLASTKVHAGIGAAAAGSGKAPLYTAAHDCITQVLKECGCGVSDVAAVVGSGMITSELGLFEVKHLPAPADFSDLAEGMQKTLIPEVFEREIWFVPGVKNTADEFEKMDMMRGEETETVALLERGLPGSAILLLPGSHMKFVAVDARGSITGCLTTISGELLAALTKHTILADAVGGGFVTEGKYDKISFLRGFNAAETAGLTRAAFGARTFVRLAGADKVQATSYLLGAVTGSDLAALSGGDFGKFDCAVIAAGEPMSSALKDACEASGLFAEIRVAVPAEGISFAARGAWLIAKRRGII